jgi:hypothetical protein
LSNLRVIYDNAADRATLSSSATASGLPVANLKSDIKSKVCRSTNKTLTITATWSTAETIDGIALAFTNGSSTATMQAQFYTVSTDTDPALDTGALTCCPSASTLSWASGQGVNSFAYGGGVYARLWLSSKVTAQKVVITITDTNNLAAYFEASRLVIGNSWTPSVVEAQGTTLQVADTSSHTRTDAGDLYTYVGTKHRKQALNLASIEPASRKQLWDILFGNGMSKPIFLSLYPNNSDASLEAVHMIYGKLATSPSMSTPYFSYVAATIEIEEV